MLLEYCQYNILGKISGSTLKEINRIILTIIPYPKSQSLITSLYSTVKVQLCRVEKESSKL